MDDKELIKRIMEEVKDEKLREELLRRVVKGEEKSVEKILKRIEHRLKAEDSLAKQEIMHGRTEKIAKIEWWGELVFTPIGFILVYGMIVGIILFVAYNIHEDFTKIPKLTWFALGLLVLAVILQIVIHVYYLLEGKKEYEKRKKEEEELEK
jgi:hypothetical protein